MGRRKRKKRGVGAPHKIIDWAIVEELMEAGCSGVEIAAYFDVCNQTFYERVANEKKMTYTDYKEKMVQRGNIPLKKKQYDEALNGNVTLLIWLGKCRLGQTDKPQSIEFKGLTEAAEWIAQAMGKSKDLVIKKENDDNSVSSCTEV